MNCIRHDDSIFINSSTLPCYANTNESLLHTKPIGIVVELPGLDGGSCLGGSMAMGDYDQEHARRFADKGILLAYLFPGPWSWGNRGSIRITDAVVDALMVRHGMDGCPLAVCGGSMGGVGALNYAVYSRHTLSGAAAACPCVDVPDRLDCMPDFPRTYISAVASYDMPLMDALKTISPMHLIDKMPRIPYYICSDGEDELFPEAQCDAYAEALRQAGHRVVYDRQPGKKHGEFTPEVRQRLHRFLEECVAGAVL